jgi:N-acetyl-gamma-glutamyl-phosphate reductase
MDAVEILAKHPCVDLVFATSNSFAGQAAPGSKLRYIKHDAADLDSVDALFLAMPHGVSADYAAKGVAAGKRVIDLSADLRLDTPESYARWYGHAHTQPQLLPVPYGLPEINRNAIRGATVVAAPGCYPTTTILGLYPLLKADVVMPDMPLIVDAKSGVSGAGREPKQNTHFVEVYGNLSPYNVGRVHRHVGEIEQELDKVNAQRGTLIFTPHLLPVDRGLMSSIYVHLKPSFKASEAQALFESAYANEPMIRVLPAGELATLKHVVRTNQAAISLSPVDEKYLLVTSVTDNLRKGASGQAVQCFNLMCGFPETTALL